MVTKANTDMTISATQSVPAIYEDGVLRPLQPLALAEHARVHITVAISDESPTAPPAPHQAELRAAFTAVGLTLVEWQAPGHPPLSADARAILAREIPPGRALSEIIQEEREGR